MFFRELPVNIFNTLADEVIHQIARLSIADTIVAMEPILQGKTGALIYWLLDLMVCFLFLRFFISSLFFLHIWRE